MKITRWDSLGEYLATAIGFQELGDRTNSDNAKLLGNASIRFNKCYCPRHELLNYSVNSGETMMNAVGKWLENNKTPGRKVSFNSF